MLIIIYHVDIGEIYVYLYTYIELDGIDGNIMIDSK